MPSKVTQRSEHYLKQTIVVYVTISCSEAGGLVHYLWPDQWNLYLMNLSTEWIIKNNEWYMKSGTRTYSEFHQLQINKNDQVQFIFGDRQ